MMSEQKKGFYYKELNQVARVIELIHQSLLNNKFDLIKGLTHLLEVLCVPFCKEKSSDEINEVPKMVLVFNGLCDLIKYEVPLEQDPEGLITTEWENARMEIANTLTVISNQGAVEQKELEPTEEDKIIYGNANASPMMRLFKNGTKNLKALSAS